METLFQIFIAECSRIVLQLSEAPIGEEQMSLFEEFAEINLIFNGFNLLHKYKEYLWEQFVSFKETFYQVEHSAYSHAELHRMLLNIKECELSYYCLMLENRRIWQHYHSYLPFDPKISDFQKKQILCKISEFLLVQKHFLQLLRIFLKDQLEHEPFHPSTSKNPLRKSPQSIILEWKGDKVHLLELLLGLYHAGRVVGKYKYLSFRAFCLIMGELFNVDFSNYSKLESSIYIRKKNYAVFFSEMKAFFDDFVAKQ